MNKTLELEAMDLLKNKWSHLYTFGYPQRPFPTNYENDLNSIIVGLTSKCVEKQKLQFAIEQLKPYLEWNSEVAYSIQKDINRLEQKLSEL